MRTKSAVVYGICMLMLVAALVLGREVEQVSSVADIKLENLPQQLGPWQCVKAGYMEDKQTEEASFYEMRFRNEQGKEVDVLLSVTRTRLGALRDWTVARMGQGWMLGPETTWKKSDVPGLPFPLVAGKRWLEKGNVRQVCINWYVSRSSQSPTYVRAELLGWKDRLLGRTGPWGQMYVISVSDGSEEELWEAVEDLAIRMAPHFYEVLNSAGQG